MGEILKTVATREDIVNAFTKTRENVATSSDVISLSEEIRNVSLSLRKWMLFFAILNVISTYIIFWIFFGK